MIVSTCSKRHPFDRRQTIFLKLTISIRQFIPYSIDLIDQFESMSQDATLKTNKTVRTDWNISSVPIGNEQIGATMMIGLTRCAVSNSVCRETSFLIGFLMMQIDDGTGFRECHRKMTIFDFDESPLSHFDPEWPKPTLSVIHNIEY